jgi:hypothetical protein
MYVDVSRGVRLSVVSPAHPLFRVLGESRRGHDHRNGNQDESKGVTYWHEVFLFVCRNAKVEERASANERALTAWYQRTITGHAGPVSDGRDCFGVWEQPVNRRQRKCLSRRRASHALVERHLLIDGDMLRIRKSRPTGLMRFPGDDSTCVRVVPCMVATALRRVVRRRKCASPSLQIASSEPMKAHLNR